ncbi:MAG: right-handed parallel beta-helix repeat-containing protein, partial [Sedimentisphaerales bacterium]|nr:right-handed parallel beta-helix repeat-containing protein [Sedimentisphaerales bacterium]
MTVESESRMTFNWKADLMFFWLTGIVVLSLWAVVRFRNLRQIHSTPIGRAGLPQWLDSLMKETAAKLRLRTLPAVVLSEFIPSPAVFGTFRPVLVLPPSAIHRLSHKRIEHILLHELAHVKRGDLLVNTFYTLLQIVYWFNPLLWLIRRRLHHLRELCCDATVARILREDTLEYRDTILETAKRFLPKPVEPGIGLLGLFETSSRLLVRLKWLEKKTWKHRGVRFVIICMVVGLMLVCVLPMARAKSADVLTVAADGSGEYGSIQEAIDAAGEGAVIRIGPGIYEESLKIDKPLTLEGAGWDRTTIMTKSVEADVFEEAMRTLNVRIQQAQSDEQRKEIAAQFETEFKEKVAKMTLFVSNSEGVVIRDVKFTSPGQRLKGRSLPMPIVEFNNAKASVSKCMVIGAPGDGIHILNGSDVEIRDSLVAAVWGTGITVGDRSSESSRLRLLDSELRNCHYAGICIRKGNDLTRIERCRVSGAAWHGIRYDDCSPIIIGNRIFGNARCGIYASGQTSATVEQNLFYVNEMVGMSCWFQNRDTIQGNTFTYNQRAGLSVLGASKPIVRENIFFSEPNGVFCGDIGSNSKFAVSDGIVTLQKNLFWNNEHNAARGIAKTRTTEGLVLDEQAGNLEMNPMLTRNGFSLTTDSPARRLGIGVAEPIGFESLWPLQPEEIAIIPDGQTRDYRQWKTPAQSAPSTQKPAVPLKRVVSPVNPSDIALLYHKDSDVRIKAIQTLAASNNPGIIDDLIRAHSVENYTPVHNAYGRALESLTGYRNIRGNGAWKAWLAGEAQAGRLKIEYLPVEPAADVQSDMIPFALVGEDSFNEMSAALTAETYNRQQCYDALRYMVFNDHLPQVQTFLSGDWLSRLFAHQGININDVGYVLNGLANPGPLRGHIDTQVRDCLDSDNPIVVANALNLIAGVEGFSTRFVVPGVEDKVTELMSSSVPDVALQARRALARVRPRKMAVPKSTIGEVKDGLHIIALIDGQDTIKINSNALWYEHHSYNLPGKWWNGADKIQY